MATRDVPERIAEAALDRIKQQQCRRQRERVDKATGSGELLAAETDAGRKLRRLMAVTGVGEADARALARGTSPESLGIEGELALGAERILGRTTDFVGVSFLEYARAAATSVGRVIARDGSAIGSGFLVSGRLFLTNNHVLRSQAESDAALVEFNYELDIRGRERAVTRFEFDPRAFFLTNEEDDLDFTLVAVGRRVTGPGGLEAFGYCPISDADDKHVLGEFVNIVQHPRGDYKQVVLRENQLVSRLEHVLHYVADTSPGSSGSPVFNDQWEAVALHHYGTPFRQTTDPDGRPLSRDMNEGIRISAIVRALAEARGGLDGAARTLLDQALRVTSRAPSLVDEERVPASTEGRTGTARPYENGVHAHTGNGVHRPTPDGSVTLSVPLEITIRLGAGGTLAGSVSSVGSSATGGGERAPDRDYANRRGYDPDFLPGFPVAFPRVTPAAGGTPARLNRPARGGERSILNYQHFSILMNADRKLAYVTAVNIDGSRSRSVNRDTGVARPGIAERLDEPAPEGAEASERWYDDPRIPADAQTTQALYDRQRPSRLFDRGHLVRREDPNWGSDAEAERANADTFHFTNCCPQASTFNQQARFWQGIENYVINNARAEDVRVSVFTGPVFSSNDPRYRDVRVPLQFFKIVARVDDGRLKAVALLASQEEFLSRLPEQIAGERFDDLGRVREYQTTVAEIEERTGLDFGPLRDADTFGDSESLDTNLRPLGSFEDVRLDEQALGYRSAVALPRR